MQLLYLSPLASESVPLNQGLEQDWKAIKFYSAVILAPSIITKSGWN